MIGMEISPIPVVFGFFFLRFLNNPVFAIPPSVIPMDAVESTFGHVAVATEIYVMERLDSSFGPNSV
jgi:hypothetical protein